MKGFLRALIVAALAIVSFQAMAQSSATPVQPGYLSLYGCPTGVTACFVPALAAIAGTERGVSMATATALTIPTKSIMAVITVSGTNNSSGVCAFWQDDGTAPTGTAGQPLSANAGMVYFVKALPIKLIQATGATCTFNASYYG